MAQLVLKNLQKSYGAIEVIRGIDLTVEHGEFCVFVGPSGCGKSTLLRLISGLQRESEGTIEIDGEIVNNLGPADRGLAMVFQSYALYPHMSVRDNLAFGLENLKTPKAKIEEKVQTAAKMLQIDSLLKRRPKDLSGGQRQRVAIGRAVVREPNVFLFDEPLSNLDAELRVEMRGEISRLHSGLGNTMIYVTHDQTEAMTMADRIAVLRDGLLEQYGKPLDLYNDPENLFVAGFIGSPRMNFFEGEVASLGDANTLATLQSEAGEFKFNVSSFDVMQGQKATIGIRPDQFELGGGLSGTVVNVEQLGNECYLVINLPNGDKATIRTPGQIDVERNQNMSIGYPEDQVHLFDTATGLTLRTKRQTTEHAKPSSKNPNDDRNETAASQNGIHSAPTLETGEEPNS